MGDSFFKVGFEGIAEDYFFHFKEDAVAFLLESYFDDYEIENEDEVMAINNEVADTNMIVNYGWVEEVWFEK